MQQSALSFLRSSFVAAAIGSACLAGALAPATAQTASSAPGGTTAGPERNVYAAGGQVRPSGPVGGDWVAVGGKVIVDQPVAGDAMLAGGSVDVRAPVGDDVRAAGGDVSVESKVDGELVASGGNITLTPSAAVGRGATFYGGRVAIAGRVDGELRATAGRIFIDGEVRGNARLVGDEIELGPKARMGGAVRYVSRSELKKAEGATIAGALTREQADPGRGEGRPQASASPWVGGAMSFLALLAAGALFLLLLPKFGVAASARLRSSPWLALGVGFGTVAALPVVAVLLFITLLGIPIGIAVLAMYPALWLAGFVVGVLFVSRLLPAALRKETPGGFGGSIGYFALGLLLTLLVAGVPFAGAMLVGLLSVAGVGACVLELHARRKGPADAVPAARPTLAAPAA